MFCEMEPRTVDKCLEVIMARNKKTVTRRPKAGQPTKYKPEYATDEYTQGFIDHCKEVKEVVTLCGYAVYIDVSEETIAEWGRVHEEYSGTLAKVKRIAKNQLYQGGLDKSLSSRITKLGLSANHGMIEKTESAITGAEGGPIAWQILTFEDKK